MSGQRCMIQMTSHALARSLASTAVAGSACSAVTCGRKTRCQSADIPDGRSEVLDSEIMPAAAAPPAIGSTRNGTEADGNGVEPQDRAEDDEGIRPLSDKLLTELTAYRTLALREAVGNAPAIAHLAVLHALCLKLFYRYGSDLCLEIDSKSVMFGAQAPGLADTPLAARVDARHRNWAEQLPEESSELWDVLGGFDTDSRDALFAHCVSLTINAVAEPYNRRPKAIAHADRLAQAVSLDLAASGWAATADNYLGRVSKARILEAVREVKGRSASERIAQLKKAEMATEAEACSAVPVGCRHRSVCRAWKRRRQRTKRPSAISRPRSILIIRPTRPR